MILRDGTVVCSGSYDGIVRLSHVGSGIALLICLLVFLYIYIHTHQVSMPLNHGTLVLFSGACLKHFYAQNNPAVSQVRFSPNSNFILVRSYICVKHFKHCTSIVFVCMYAITGVHTFVYLRYQH